MKKEAKCYILHVLGRLDRAGAETLVMNLYRHMDREIIQFGFVVHTESQCDYDKEVEELGGEIFHAPRYNGKNHFQYIRWWKVFFRQNNRYLILHSHLRAAASLYLPIAKKYGLVTIAHSHSISNGRGVMGLIKNIMQSTVKYRADYLFACSESAGKWMFGNDVVKKNNYKIIPNAIDSKQFIFNEEIRNKIRKDMGIDDAFVVGHVGRMSEVKNHEFLLDIFAVIHKKKANSRLILVGDGELRKAIEMKIERLHLQGAVTLIGNKSKVQDYYQIMDVFVFPSLWEGLGIAVIEAQASGLPCVISDKIPGEADIGAGLVITKDLLDGVNSWANIIMKQKDLTRKNQINAIKKANYDITKNAKELQNFYINVCERCKDVPFEVR